MGLNEVAAEAIALGHDLGHTPFGHAGETALNDIMKDKCRELQINASICRVPILGFDHCVHAIEVVSRIEQEYAHETKRGGLNLTQDVRDGILKHMYDQAVTRDRPLSSIESVAEIATYQVYGLNKGSLEAQCVYFADKLAYLLGDVEDGIRSNILKCKDVAMDNAFFEALSRKFEELRGNGAELKLEEAKDFPSFRSKVLALMILDCIERATTAIDEQHIRNVDDVLDCNIRLIWVSEKIAREWEAFYLNWMKGHLFQHEDVVACGFKAKEIVRGLFDACYNNVNLINTAYRSHCERAYADVCDSKSDLFRLILVRNYVAGMTDSFAIQQHARLFMSSERISV